MRFLAIGECMAELAPSAGAGNFTLGFAGDTFNTAWYLARIASDLNVGYLTAVGDDRMSADLHAFISASGISGDHILTIPDRTVGLYLIHLQDGERSFSYWRSWSAATQLAVDPERLAKAMAGVDLIYLSGITLAILDHPSRANLMDALGRARTSGAQIAFDPNLRPSLWRTTEAMTGANTQAATLSDIVRPSFEDEAIWFADTTPSETRDRYASAGVQRIIIKNSEKPVVFWWDGREGEVPVDQLRHVTDTTATGASFNAGVVFPH